MQKQDVKTLFIGFDGEQVVDYATTRGQIEELKKLESALENDGAKIGWETFDNPQEPRTIFQFITGDRKVRVDEHTPMADRPSIAVATVIAGKVVRLEYYEGHDALKLSFDVRSKELAGKKLPRWMESDPQAYNPWEFLKEVSGFPVPEELIQAKDEENKTT